MERLTKVDDQGRLLAYSISDTGLHTIVMKGNPYRELIERLKAYEDTGLTPEEILGRKMLAGWIPVEERLPKRKEWIVTDGEEHYLRRLEVAVASDTLEYFFVSYDGYKWFDKFGRTYGNVVAWKIHEPLNPQN